jgi:hypothetical protein
VAEEYCWTMTQGTGRSCCSLSSSMVLGLWISARFLQIYVYIQGDQNVSVHLMITVEKTRKNILNVFNHLP